MLVCQDQPLHYMASLRSSWLPQYLGILSSISVKKDVKDVVLVLDNLSLTSKNSAPLLIKASSEVIVHLVGNSSLVDGELDASAKTYEGASIKLKNITLRIWEFI